MIAGPSFPQGASETIARAQRFIPDDGPFGIRLPGLGVLARRYDRSGPAFRDGVTALTSVVSAVCCHGGNVLIGRDLRQQFGEHGGITNARARDLNSANFQRFLVDRDMELAPLAAH